MAELLAETTATPPEAHADDRYFTELAVAFVRGQLGDSAPAAVAPEGALRMAADAGLRLHDFKRSALLRVRRVLGVLRALAPESVLDVGSGRGAFLWPLLDAFPSLPVIAIDNNARAVGNIHAVRLGGVARLTAWCADVRRLPLSDDSIDVVTILEVLEHLEQPQRAAAEAVRVARRCVVASVPSRPDNNPEHIHLFTKAAFERLFLDVGAERLTIEYVHNHMIAVARLASAPDRAW
jgi:ubiquinone/menaquinone biosynthesis C-methylase UbiE